jgi:lipopolysaccharide transport system permease protein
LNSNSPIYGKISSNYLGFLWWFAEPLLLMIVFYVVFGLLFERGGENYVQILVTGIVSWVWFAGTVSQSTHAIYAERMLLAQVYIPKYLLPTVIIAESFIRQFIVIAVLLILLATTTGVYASWLWLPVILLVQFLLIAAVSLWVAALIPFIPDLRYVVSAGIRALMFCSGVFFRTNDIPEKYKFLLIYNPIANVISQYRTSLIAGSMPDLASMAVIAFGSLVVIILALLFLARFDLEYPRLVT